MSKNSANPITPELLLRAYATGIFPMAESHDSDQIHWIDPRLRGIFPLDGFHISRNLRKTLRSGRFEPRFNSAFEQVLNACADRPDTWINPEIHGLYMGLHRQGHAVSQEIWQDDVLVGGVYGVCLAGAFFGESMFSTQSNASKAALVWLIDRLRLTGFVLFDTQFITPHLQSLGAVEISRLEYHKRLETALTCRAEISELHHAQSAQDVIQRNTQTS